jgi:drug/metabolite transporter (DMT)-like permease
MAVAFALLAGLSYSGAAVLQQRVASAQPPELSLHVRLILAVARRPLWLLGVAFDVGGYLFEAAALHAGSVALVGPLMVTGLLWALPFSTIGTGRRVTRRELVPAAAVVIGLGLFVQVGSPSGNRSDASASAWVTVAALVALLAGSLVAAARRALGSRRALYLGVATGVVYSFTAVLTKATVGLLDDGIGNLFSHWQLYVLLSVSLVGLVLNQSAFQAGHVAASLPAISVVNPVLASVFAITMFGEQLDAHGALAVSVTVLAIAAMVVGTISLARSPLVTHDDVVA